MPMCVLPLRPRDVGALQGPKPTAAAVTLAEWLVDAPSRMPLDPDLRCRGDAVERLCTQLNMGYRPTSHAAAWVRPHIVKSACGLFDNRHRVVFTARPVDCADCLRATS